MPKALALACCIRSWIGDIVVDELDVLTGLEDESELGSDPDVAESAIAARTGPGLGEGGR